MIKANYYLSQMVKANVDFFFFFLVLKCPYVQEHNIKVLNWNR